jgi:hypothetical protein
VLTGYVISDLTLVFGFLSGVTECLISFILPSLFWFISLRINDSKNLTQAFKPASLCEKAMASLFFAFGFAYFVVSNYFNVVKILRAT